MASVDNRVVRMEFDNAAFEKRLHQTLQSLAQLDKSLKLTGAQKGLTDVASAAKKVDLSHMGAAVEGVSAKFIALSTIAITALSQIASAAFRAGGNMVKSLSLDPIIEGFKEYELNIGSIQTILANTKADGTNLQQVNDALDQLNEYSDKTIYNFGQMTKNIGTFTAAGVDLDTSVQSIKGISNLAAISGSSAEQAATAMYQLSQAVSTGTLRLMDWNSVVNAGMGGEVFQKALFETGKAMGTLEGVPMDQTFEEWTKAGNSFRDSLQDGWLTGEVLTNTLKGFTGEMTEAQLLSIGYTKEQAAEILELGKTGVEAATKIRTFTQLLQTVKETVASGWSESFRTVFGNFEEASVLFTEINDAVSGFVKSSADARNELLSGWKAFGGRGLLIEGIVTAFKALGSVLNAVKLAFREVFPPVTAERLVLITKAFRDFTQSLTPSQKTLENIRRIFSGFFSVLSIGGQVIKGFVGFVKDLFLNLTGLGNGNVLEFAADIADFFTALRDGLKDGNDIQNFFDRLGEGADKVVDFLRNLKESFLGLFDGFDDGKADKAGESVGRIGQRLEQLGGVFERLKDLGQGFSDFFQGVMDVLNEVGDAIAEWLGELGDKLADAMGPGDFDAVIDAFNVSLLGGIALLISKWLSGGINFDFGNGFFSNITEAFGELTGVLEAMQTSIKADALLKIAGALALLTASVVALSLIDSEALTRSLVAMAVGFGQLMATFGILNAMDVGIFNGATFATISAGMIGLSTAILILSGAVAILSTMSWGELAKGLTAVTLLLAVLTANAIILSKNAGSVILASVSMSAMAVALTLLSGAVAIFGNMEWDTLVKGFAGVAAGLLIMAGAMHLMPEDMFLRAAGLVLIATSLNILALAVKSFAEMEWGEMAKGMVGIGAGLLIIAGAMQLMPDNMLRMSAGLVLVGIALNGIAFAVKQFGGMSLEALGKGIAGLGASLFIIAAATKAMEGSIRGAAGIAIVAAAVGALGLVLVEISKVPFGELVLAIGAIAIAIGVLVAAAYLAEPVTPALLALGVALIAVGASFALFGAGAYLVAEAFKTLGEAGPEAAENLTAALEAIGKALPSLMKGFAEGIVEIVKVITEAAPVIAKGIAVLVGHILDSLKEVIPKAAELFVELISTLIQVVVRLAPDIIAAGIFLIITFLQGIKDNIYQITDLVLEIITLFLLALGDNIEQIVAAGTDVIVKFIEGITNSVDQIGTAASTLMTTFMITVAGFFQNIVDVGVQLVVNFINGITDSVGKIVTAVGTLIVTFIFAVGNLASYITTAGADVIVNFVTGMSNNQQRIITAITNAVTALILAVAGMASQIVTAGSNAILNFVVGLGRNVNRLISAGVTVITNFLEGIASNGIRLADTAAGILIDFLNALAEVIRRRSAELRQAGWNIATAIIDGVTGGLSSKAGGLAESTVNVVKDAWGAARDFLGMSSPSKLFMEMGGYMGDGLAIGLDKNKSSEKAGGSLASRTTQAFQEALARATMSLEDMGELNPVITPVLDLTRVQEGAKAISGYLGQDPGLTPVTSLNAARNIAATSTPVDESSSTEAGNVLTFEQNIYAPEQLSTADIYRQTRNQITFAKEELDVA